MKNNKCKTTETSETKGKEQNFVVLTHKQTKARTRQKKHTHTQCMENKQCNNVWREGERESKWNIYS